MDVHHPVVHFLSGTVIVVEAFEIREESEPALLWISSSFDCTLPGVVSLSTSELCFSKLSAVSPDAEEEGAIDCAGDPGRD